MKLAIIFRILLNTEKACGPIAVFVSAHGLLPHFELQLYFYYLYYVAISNWFTEK